MLGRLRHFHLDIWREEAQNPETMLKKILLGIGIVVLVLAGLVTFALYHYPKAQIDRSA
jgi:hypothetical protein